MSFKYRFLIAFITIEIFFIFLIVGLNFFTINERFDEYIKEKITSTNTLMRELVKSPLSVYDLATLDNIVENSKSIKNIKYVIIADSHDKIVSSNYENEYKYLKKYEKIDEIHEVKNGKNLVFTKTDVINDDVNIGHIHIIYDITESLMAIEENKKQTYYLIFLEILISIIIAYFIGRNLTQKLLNLSNVALEIGKNSNVEVPYINNKDEVGILASTMNKMKKEIKARNEKLNLYAEMFSNTKESIVLTDNMGIILDVNEAFVKITGFSKEDVITKKTNILSSKKHDKFFYDEMWRMILRDGYWSGEIVNKNKNGEFYTSLLNISSIKDEKNNITNFIGISTDITKIKEKELILQTHAKMATLGEMLKNIAHQWRQPLSAITSSATSTIVQKEVGILDDNTLSNNLNNIIKSSNYLSQTIDDFRNFFNEEKVFSTFNIKNTIDSSMSIINSNLKNSNVEIIIDIEEEFIISSFENELIQIFLNIINNSKDALIERKNEKLKKYVFLNVKKIDNRLKIVIKDNAGGVSNEIIDKIFEPYFTTKHKSQGTGIGLYMTHIIVIEHLKGTIDVKNSKYVYNGVDYRGLETTIILPMKLIS